MSMKELKAKMKTYIYQLESGEIKNKQVRILKYIIENPTKDLTNSNTDILTMKKRLGMAHQSLTAGVSVLEDLGLIKVIGQIQIENFHYSVFQYVENHFEREKLIEERLKDKYKNWVNSGLTNFKELLPTEVLFHLSMIN